MPELGAGRAAPVEMVVLASNSQGVADIAVSLLDRGTRVAVLSDSAGTAGEIAARVRAVYDGAVARGRLDTGKRDQRLIRLSHGGDRNVLGDADLVLDAGDVALGGAQAGGNTVWAVMDDAAPAAARAAEAGVAGRAVALRLYRPAYSAKLCEIAVPEGAGADAVATVVQFLSAGGLSVLRTVETPGMLGHNLMGAGLRAALALVRAGADPYAVDEAAQALGFQRGPFRMIEAEGIAAVLARLRRITQARNLADAAELDLLEARQAAFEAGQTPGRAFHAVQGQDVVPDPGLEAWLAAWREGQAGDAPDLPGVPLSVALHAALVNEGARMIQARAVLRASDIDLCMVRGYGFDPAQGGPLLAADIAGLLGLVRAMKQLAPLSESLWAPQPMVEDLVKYGRRFFGPVS